MIKNFLKISILLLISVLNYQQVNAISDKKMNIVLLGDSYSAGNGAGGYSGPRYCYRSHNNWASILVKHLNNQGVKASLHNRACSGAKTFDIYQERKINDVSKNKILDGKLDFIDAKNFILNNKTSVCKITTGDDFSHFEIKNIKVKNKIIKGQSKTIVNYDCFEYIKPQIDFIGPETDLVLMTIGGNNLNFKNIVMNCFLLMDGNKCRSSINDARKTMITNVKEHTNIALEAIFSKLNSDAKVIFLGYPLLSLDTNFKSAVDFYPIAQEVRLLGKAGNHVQKQIVDAFNQTHNNRVLFIESVPEVFKNHEPDPSNFKNPKRWINELLDPGFDVNEWYHPNPKGQQAYADLLKQQSLQDYAKVINNTSADIDMVFNLDTTGSMSDEIITIKNEIKNIIEQTNNKTNSARFAIVSFRDFPERTNYPGDYPAKVVSNFTTSQETLSLALDNLDLGDGGDTPETAFSGMMTSLNLNWRNGVHKIVITITDAPPHNKEPITNYTSDQVIQKAFAVDPAQLYFINTGSSSNEAYYKPIANDTGGQYFPSSSVMVDKIINDVINKQIAKPHAWIDGPYLVKTGEPLTIDAGGCYSTNGKIVKYEWDFNQNSDPDLITTEPIITHTFTQDFYGLIGLTVTDEAGVSNVATTPLIVSNDGDAIPPDEDNCPNHDNTSQLDSDHDGVGDACDKTHGNPWVEMYQKAQADYQQKIETEIKQAVQAQTTNKPITTKLAITRTINQNQQKLAINKPSQSAKKNNQPIKSAKLVTEINQTKKPNQTKTKTSPIHQTLLNIGETNLYIILTIFALLVSFGTVKLVD